MQSQHRSSKRVDLAAIVMLFGVLALAQALATPAGAQEISNMLNYDRVTAFTQNAGIGHLRLSGDGSRIIYSTGSKKIFTMNSDGTGRSEIFNYADHRPGSPFVTPFIDISDDGSKVIWTDGVKEIYVADFDGGNRSALATEFPRPDGLGTVGPEISTRPVLSPDGLQIFFTNSLGRGVILNWSTSAG
ncbi:MAG: TolB family protein, partial [Verrucomicrobiales bacterium]